MKRLLRYFLICALFVTQPYMATAQSLRTHKVQKKETQFGIAQMYGITVEQLVQANPGMEEPGFKLKKGMMIVIPEPVKVQANNQNMQNSSTDVRQRSIRLSLDWISGLRRLVPITEKLIEFVSLKQKLRISF